MIPCMCHDRDIRSPCTLLSDRIHVFAVHLLYVLPFPFLSICPVSPPIGERVCQDHVQLRTLIRLLRSHRSTVAQLRTSAHYSGPGRAHTLPLSATLCIRLNPVVTTLPRLPCCTVSSLCSVCIFYLVVFSPDLTYFHWT